MWWWWSERSGARVGGETRDGGGAGCAGRVATLTVGAGVGGPQRVERPRDRETESRVGWEHRLPRRLDGEVAVADARVCRGDTLAASAEGEIMTQSKSTDALVAHPEAPESVAPPSPPRTGRRWLVVVAAGAVIVAAALVARDYFAVARPVSQTMEAGSRNSGIELTGHFKYRLVSSTLVLDLHGSVSASAAALFRTLFQAADALHREERAFDEVLIARNGVTVFVIGGRDFDEIGRASGAGENPLYLLRTLPEKLRRPDGSRAFGEWEGGILGVTARQLEDVTKAASTWMQGER